MKIKTALIIGLVILGITLMFMFAALGVEDTHERPSYDVNDVMKDYPCLRDSGWEPSKFVYEDLHLVQLEANCILRAKTEGFENWVLR